MTDIVKSVHDYSKLISRSTALQLRILASEISDLPEMMYKTIKVPVPWPIIDYHVKLLCLHIRSFRENPVNKLTQLLVVSVRVTKIKTNTVVSPYQGDQLVSDQLQ